ncbi:nucleotidyltransferase family protein [Cuspidothrix issatschenkoi]|jgi:predicted nucleotidyltransferase|uniref:Nucleotidyltransferase n=1 Tax=Cuspidothrix issatschenkoi CHARLIE-1 TaxID=2052836 RepID=A0A2S6CTJ3_9CYAN|nr:nucleotidyltransferase family protein [Cuspidothrix issatschenkoi]PPJ62920.1 nucleotidyltransferase [Cuspidothrix issatschenkoi CHARLIE-1]
MNCEEVLQILRTHQQELQNLGVRSLELFGSVARNQAHSDSDVDLLAELSESMSLFQFIEAKLYIQDLLKCPVDMGTKDALCEHLRQPILEDIVYVF